MDLIFTLHWHLNGRKNVCFGVSVFMTRTARAIWQNLIFPCHRNYVCLRCNRKHMLHVSCICSQLAGATQSEHISTAIDILLYGIRPSNGEVHMVVSTAFLGSATTIKTRKTKRMEELKSFLFRFRHPASTVFDIFFVESLEKMSACFCRRYDRISWLFFGEGKICRFTYKRIESNDKRWARIRKRKEVAKWVNWIETTTC